MVDVATVVGTAEDKFLFSHLARANAAPTKAATAPTIAEVTSTIYSCLGYSAEDDALFGAGVGDDRALVLSLVSSSVLGFVLDKPYVGDVVVGISGIINMIGLMDGLRVGLITDGRGVGKGVEGIGVFSTSAVYSTAPVVGTLVAIVLSSINVPSGISDISNVLSIMHRPPPEVILKYFS